MATHSCVLAWKISWTEEPGVLHIHGVPQSWTWLNNYAHSQAQGILPQKVTQFLWTTVFSVADWAQEGQIVGRIREHLCKILCIEFFRQKYWSGLPFPSPGDLSNPGIEPKSPALQADSLPTEPLGNPSVYMSVPFIPVYPIPPFLFTLHSFLFCPSDW